MRIDHKQLLAELREDALWAAVILFTMYLVATSVLMVYVSIVHYNDYMKIAADLSSDSQEARDRLNANPAIKFVRDPNSVVR